MNYYIKLHYISNRAELKEKSPLWKVENQGFKGIGGVQVKVSDFSCFDICFSPEYLVSKMGSLAPQLATAHEIWRDEVGHYAHIFGKMYREPPKIRGAKISPRSTFRATRKSTLAINQFQGRFHEYLVTYRARFSIFCFFDDFWPLFGPNLAVFMIFGQFLPKNRAKIDKKTKYPKSGSVRH